MNYDCELIRDIAPLYRDGALSEGGKKIVEEHLAQCAVCREYYADEDDRTLPALPHDSETQEIALLSKKLKKRRLYQVGMFAAVLALLFFCCRPGLVIPASQKLRGLLSSPIRWLLQGWPAFYLRSGTRLHIVPDGSPAVIRGSSSCSAWNCWNF